MTVLVCLDESISLERIREYFDSSHVRSYITDVTGSIENIRIAHNRFNNSLIFKCHAIKNIDRVIEKPSLKVFANGSLHITGVKSTCDALYLADIFATMFELMEGGNGVSGWFNVKSFDVQLMNIYFKLDIASNKRIDLVYFRQLVAEHSHFYATYNNERHAGVIIKAPNFTVIVFETGNILLSSLKTILQIDDSYTYITEFVRIHLQKALIDVVEDRVEKFDYSSYLVLK